ncbi:MAG: peptidoglycan editing factor PgeF [Anaerolineae bacterium]
MERHQNGALVYYRFASLARHPELIHGVFTRLGGMSQPPYASLNVGHTVGDNLEAVEANHACICQALGIAREAIATARQVHGSRVAVVGGEDCGRVLPATDALVTNVPGVALMLRFADCVPLLLYDPLRRAIGLAHAGWRGTVEKLAQKTVLAMVKAFGSRPRDLIAALGPAIGPCCYQVGEEVARAVREALGGGAGLLQEQSDGSLHFGLWRANQRQLAAIGVERIEVAELCTACRVDEFFSHRAEKGRTGRFGVVMGLREK